MQTICNMKSDMRVAHELLNAVLFILCYHLPKAEIDVLLIYVQALLASQIARLSWFKPFLSLENVVNARFFGHSYMKLSDVFWLESHLDM